MNYLDYKKQKMTGTIFVKKTGAITSSVLLVRPVDAENSSPVLPRSGVRLGVETIISLGVITSASTAHIKTPVTANLMILRGGPSDPDSHLESYTPGTCQYVPVRTDLYRPVL